MRTRTLLSLFLLAAVAAAQNKYSDAAVKLRDIGLTQLGAHSLLKELTGIGPRISGSENAERAVQWGKSTMERLGFQNVRLQPCMVPHWVRGDVESCAMSVAGQPVKLTCCALGSSSGTPEEGVSAEVVEVQSLQELEKLGERVKGKIVFFNRPFDAKLVSTFAQYGSAGDQRFAGPAAAAKAGAVAALVRSMTGDPDDVPHTGTTRDPKIPAAALSIIAADRLSQELKRNPGVKVTLTLSCKNLPPVPSANVIGEIVGSEKPNEVIVMGGHLDSWDKGQGAHDDGAGITQSLEALSLIQKAGLRPKRTIRVVLFMDEEQGGSGAAAYAEYAKTSKEKHIAAMESDSGGFAPRSFGCSLKDTKRLNKWLPALSMFEIDKINGGGGGGADVGPLAQFGAVLFGLQPESQRYFDYHHSDKDTIDKVHPRELELGALSMATLAWFISEDGV